MDIIVDTREQLPLFKNNCIRYGLLVGDYSTMKLRHTFAIERKSLADLYSTITKGHVRFRKEHIRATANGIELVLYVEGSKEDFELKNWPGGNRRDCKGETLIKIIDSIEQRWPLEVVWCSSRANCKYRIQERLFIEEKLLLQKQALEETNKLFNKASKAFTKLVNKYEDVKKGSKLLKNRAKP